MPLVMAAPRVMVSAPVPPVMLAELLMVPVLPPLARMSLIGAGAEVDRHGGGDSAGERDGVVAGAAGERSRRW